MPTLSHEEPRRNVDVPPLYDRCAAAPPSQERAGYAAHPRVVAYERTGAVSQEERDARLGLTGLTNPEREARLRLLREQIAREVAAARAALDAQRSGRRASQDAAPAFDAPKEE